jgi:DNA gyrase/topoisomerase IV subunit B
MLRRPTKRPASGADGSKSKRRKGSGGTTDDAGRGGDDTAFDKTHHKYDMRQAVRMNPENEVGQQPFTTIPHIEFGPASVRDADLTACAATEQALARGRSLPGVGTSTRPTPSNPVGVWPDGCIDGLPLDMVPPTRMLGAISDREGCMPAAGVFGSVASLVLQLTAEVFGNARDQMMLKRAVGRIDINIDPAEGSIEVTNFGSGIPNRSHVVGDTKMPLLQACYTEDRFSSSRKIAADGSVAARALVGGKNGKGVKIVSVLSRYMRVVTSAGAGKAVSTLTLIDGMRKEHTTHKVHPADWEGRLDEGAFCSVKFWPDWSCVSKSLPSHAPMLRVYSVLASLRSFCAMLMIHSHDIVGKKCEFRLNGEVVDLPAAKDALGEGEFPDGARMPTLAAVLTAARPNEIIGSWDKERFDKDRAPGTKYRRYSIAAAHLADASATLGSGEPRDIVSWIRKSSSHSPALRMPMVGESTAASASASASASSSSSSSSARSSSAGDGSAFSVKELQRIREEADTQFSPTPLATGAVCSVNGIPCGRGHHIQALVVSLSTGLLPVITSSLSQSKTISAKTKTVLHKRASKKATGAAKREARAALSEDEAKKLKVITSALGSTALLGNIFIVGAYTIEEPSYTGQDKRQLYMPSKDIGFPVTISNTLISRWAKNSGIMVAIADNIEQRVADDKLRKQQAERRAVTASGGSQRVTGKSIVSLPNLSDAIFAGVRGCANAKHRPVLIATEGVSASRFASSIKSDSPKLVGTYRFKGKPLNGMKGVATAIFAKLPEPYRSWLVENSPPSLRTVLEREGPPPPMKRSVDWRTALSVPGGDALMDSAEIRGLLLSLGIVAGVDYMDDSAVNDLRYGRLLICSDQDVDGFHIACIIVANILITNPSLLRRFPDFVCRVYTPLIIARFSSSGHRALFRLAEERGEDWVFDRLIPSKAFPGAAEFFSQHAFEELVQAADLQLHDFQGTPKYCKGLGGHSSKTAKIFLEGISDAGSNILPSMVGRAENDSMPGVTGARLTEAGIVLGPTPKHSGKYHTAKTSYVVPMSLPLAETSGQQHIAKIALAMGPATEWRKSAITALRTTGFLTALEGSVVSGDEAITESSPAEELDALEEAPVRHDIVRDVDEWRDMVGYDHPAAERRLVRVPNILIPPYFNGRAARSAPAGDTVLSELVQYSFATMTRNIPGCDGLKDGARRVLFVSAGVTKPVKLDLHVSAIANQTAYDHGTVSLENTCNVLAAAPVGSVGMNVLLLRLTGQVRTIAENNDVAARYNKILATPFLQNLVEKHVMAVLPRSIDDGKVTGVHSFIGKMPLGLLNGGSNPATGFKTSTFPHHPMHIWHACNYFAQLLVEHRRQQGTAGVALVTEVDTRLRRALTESVAAGFEDSVTACEEFLGGRDGTSSVDLVCRAVLDGPAPADWPLPLRCAHDRFLRCFWSLRPCFMHPVPYPAAEVVIKNGVPRTKFQHHARAVISKKNFGASRRKDILRVHILSLPAGYYVDRVLEKLRVKYMNTKKVLNFDAIKSNNHVHIQVEMTSESLAELGGLNKFVRKLCPPWTETDEHMTEMTPEGSIRETRDIKTRFLDFARMRIASLEAAWQNDCMAIAIDVLKTAATVRFIRAVDADDIRPTKMSTEEIDEWLRDHDFPTDDDVAAWLPPSRRLDVIATKAEDDGTEEHSSFNYLMRLPTRRLARNEALKSEKKLVSLLGKLHSRIQDRPENEWLRSLEEFQPQVEEAMAFRREYNGNMPADDMVEPLPPDATPPDGYVFRTEEELASGAFEEVGRWEDSEAGRPYRPLPYTDAAAHRGACNAWPCVTACDNPFKFSEACSDDYGPRGEHFPSTTEVFSP